MKGFIPLVVLAAVAAGGCQPAQNPHGDRGAQVNQWLVRSYSDDAIKNAILAQRTLYPYHFVRDGAALNALGEHDLGVLAEHFKDHPGTLNVRQGEADGQLYRQRVQAVAAALETAGVEPSRVKIAGGLPGGDGMASDEAVEALERQSRPAVTAGTVSSVGVTGAQ